MAGLNHKKWIWDRSVIIEKELFSKSVQSILASEKIADAAESFWVVYRGRRTGNFGTVEVISLNGNNVFETEVQRNEL